MSLSSWWHAAWRCLRGPQGHRTGATAASGDGVLDQLLPKLPAPARARLLRRLDAKGTRPQTAEALLSLMQAWSVGAGIAEGRGGYPGGTDAPGWSEYVAEQRDVASIYQAALAAFGETVASRSAYFHSLAARFAPSMRLMGDGYEPHVDEEAGRLLYGLPVDSGFVGTAFSFEIQRADVDVLLSDPYRRAVLEVVAHTKLQRAMTRGSSPISSADFAGLVAAVLHGAPEDLQSFIADVDREHNVHVAAFVAQAMARRSAG